VLGAVWELGGLEGHRQLFHVWAVGTFRLVKEVVQNVLGLHEVFLTALGGKDFPVIVYR